MLALSCGLLFSPQLIAQTYGDYAITVEVTGNGYAHSTIIYFDDESWDPLNPPTYGWDACCDAQSLAVAFPQPQVFTEVVAPPGPTNFYRLGINGLPHVFEQTDVPLGFLPGELAQYLFTFKELYTIPEGITVELEDLTQNVTQDLLVDSTYETWSAPSDDEARFIVHLLPSAITGIESASESGTPRIVMTNEGIRITQIDADEKYDFLFVDMQGRVVWNGKINGRAEYIHELNGLVAGVYIATIVGEDGSRTVQKIVRL